MKPPQHPTLPLLSVALFSYLCGDLTCAIMGRHFNDRPQHLATGPTTTAPAGPNNPGELMALLNTHPRVAPAPPDDPPVPSAPLPTLVGTLEGQGKSMAVLQAEGEPAVVAVGEDFHGFQVLAVSALQARLRDSQGQEHTLSMMVEFQPPPPHQILPNLYTTTRQLRQDLDNKDGWIGHILIKPTERGVQINYRDGDNPFARLGLQSGDVVLALNNKPARSMDDLPELLADLRNSQTLAFQLERNGLTLPLTVILEP